MPPEGRIELIMQTLPGEERSEFTREQEDWLDSLVQRYPKVFIHGLQCATGSACCRARPSIRSIHSYKPCRSAPRRSGTPPVVIGAPYACDMFALHQIFGMPGLLFGPTGANAHAADEYLELDSLFAFFEIMALFVMEWCGAAA